ncbi:hypothetical protein SAMN04487843_104337 [Methylobacterium sp. ap11]|nr:hypothetical protein SAMN04487843_104337 [Methylobacterium sp. ap11]
MGRSSPPTSSHPIYRFPTSRSACDSKRIGVMLDMQALYAQLESEIGWKMEMKPWSTVDQLGVPRARE